MISTVSIVIMTFLYERESEEFENGVWINGCD